MLCILSKHFILYINSKHYICQARLCPFEGAVSKVFQCDFVTGFFIGGLTTRCVTPRVSPKGEKGRCVCQCLYCNSSFSTYKIVLITGNYQLDRLQISTITIEIVGFNSSCIFESTLFRLITKYSFQRDIINILLQCKVISFWNLFFKFTLYTKHLTKQGFIN